MAVKAMVGNKRVPSVDITRLSVLLQTIAKHDIDLEEMVLAQVVSGDGTQVFNVGCSFGVTEGGKPYFHMDHPDLGIYSVSKSGGSADIVQIPKTVEQAQAMKAVAERYIETHTRR
tara:strand:- start:44721 stop:45068 length:348 start_codon:yes stop_codon:yes gene_type:complete